MDKVKIALAILKKYHFWVLCVLVILTSFGVSVMATSDLESQLADGIRTLESSFSSVESVSHTSPHPNQKSIDRFKGGTEILKQDVLDAWTILYDEQAKKNQLADDLGEDFKREFDAGGEISRRNLEHYQTFIRSRFDLLFNDVLNVRRPADPSAVAAAPAVPANATRPGGAPAKTNKPKEIGVVKWGKHLEVKAEYDWPNRPTTEQVRTAQENLWVYEALFRVIANTNAEPDSTETLEHHNAAVKEILSLDIGADASDDGEAESIGTMGDSNGPSRYVDLNGNPLTPDSPGAAEYNIMPIRMVLSIEQSTIPKLLVECANSNMPIEVRGVSIRPGRGQTLDLESNESSNRTRKQDANLINETNTGASHIPVEIQGLIYIYNKPDLTKLGTGAVVESSDATADSGASDEEYDY